MRYDHHLSSLKMRRSVPGNRKARGALQLDIERMFAKKLQIFGGVEFNREAIIVAVMKTSFK